MLGFLYQPLGKKLLNDYMQLFKDEFKLDYWGRIWLFWAACLNIFFGLINILAAKWEHLELMLFLIKVDLVAYLIFVGLAIWGLLAGRLGKGVYSVFIVFAGWISWGTWTIIQHYIK
jgi:hypothetical protein